MKHEDGRVITVPDYGGDDIDRTLLKKILRDAQITPEVFIENV